MSFPRLIILGSLSLFVVIGVVAVAKKLREPVAISEEASPALSKEPCSTNNIVSSQPKPQVVLIESMAQEVPSLSPVPPINSILPPLRATDVVEDFPQIDRISQLFTTKGARLPIVDTITYTSRVEWLKGRPAWVADYASHYATSRHFIARSLNGKADYFTQKVSTGSKFNVFRRDKEVQFYFLIDVSRCKMAFYYLDVGTNERVLLKTYSVGLGRLDSHAPSGCLTPLGIYSLGNKIAIYKPGMVGHFADKPVEMVRVFGTRWIPFDQEFEGCTASAKGYGLHGAPVYQDASSGQLVENRTCIGTYDSDGCIRLSSEDIEEIFSIVITKPSFVVIVKDFREAQLPGTEVAIPSR